MSSTVKGQPNRPAIWWIRRDLRLFDNPALSIAASQHQTVIPVFVLDPALLNARTLSNRRLAFLFAGLRKLDVDLRRRGSRIIIRNGKPMDVLRSLVSESGAGSLYAQEDFSPYARKRDAEIARELPLELVSGPTLRHPEEICKKDGSPYIVYTPFMHTWLDKAFPAPGSLLPVPARLHTPKNIHSETLPDTPLHNLEHIFPAGENAARRKLQHFTGNLNSGIFAYQQQRDFLDMDGTSMLSPYLRMGAISIRQVVITALDCLKNASSPEGRQGVQTWLNELIWREFYTSILYHFPHVLRRSFRAQMENIPWRNPVEDFQAWTNGRTGFPVVDAAMRQLEEIGWVHNRARMLAASFLVKNLLVDWRWGERWYMQHLVDGDPAANNGGWQWVAGTGTDAAPYFRIFNPVTQGKKYDPQGDYIRRWIPELRSVPNRFIHTPWQMPIDLQHQTGCIIGRHYPTPIVDLNETRKLALAAYDTARSHYKI
jgi:deoxyribodipyrimidine photo-lyase